jgi:hypothetical protein
MRTAGFALRLSLMGAAFSAGCGLFTGPSKSVEGSWSAQGIGHLGDHFEMSLTQNGKTITGVVCRADSSFLSYHDVPVAGESPHVTFTEINLFGGMQTFSGKFEDDRDQIAGNFADPRGGPVTQLRFFRSQTGHCDGVRPLP